MVKRELGSCPGRAVKMISGSVATRAFMLALLVMTAMEVAAEQSNQDEALGAKRLLHQMTHAMKNMDYQGTVVYLRDNRVDTHKVFHSITNGVEQERMIALNSPMREIVRTANTVTCFFPDSKTIIERRPSQRSLLVNLPEDIDSHSDYYQFILGPIEHVVQRETQVVSIQPRDDLRYGRLIWIDRETSLPLKFELLNEKLEPLEQMVFTSISTEGVPPAKMLNAPAQAELLSQRSNVSSNIDDINWRFLSLPSGFSEVFHLRRKKPEWNHSVEHIMLSDGFASVSVYIEKSDKPGSMTAENRSPRFGAVHSSFRQIKDYQVTVLGEAPQKTIDWISKGLTIGALQHD